MSSLEITIPDIGDAEDVEVTEPEHFILEIGHRTLDVVVEDDFKSRKRLRDVPSAVSYKINQAACADEVIR